LKGLQLQIGDTSADYNKITVSIGDMHTTSLKKYESDGTTISTLKNGEQATIKNLDISTQEGASESVDVIKAQSTRYLLLVVTSVLHRTVLSIQSTTFLL